MGSLPSVNTKMHTSPTKSIEPNSQKVTPDKPRSISREDLYQTKLRLEISQKDTFDNRNNNSSINIEDHDDNQPDSAMALQQQDQVIQLPKIIQVHKNQDNSVQQVSRFKSSLGIVHQKHSTQHRQPHDRFKLLQYRSAEQVQEETKIERFLVD